MSHPVIIKPSSIYGYGIYFVIPSHQDRLWCFEETLSEALERGKKSLIAYIEDQEGTLITPDKYVWQPKLTREKVKEILSSQSNYAAFLCGNDNDKSVCVPKDLDALAECGINFGGAVYLARHIKKAIANNKPLVFSNYSGFTIDIPLKIAQEYLNHYDYVT